MQQNNPSDDPEMTSVVNGQESRNGKEDNLQLKSCPFNLKLTSNSPLVDRDNDHKHCSRSHPLAALATDFLNNSFDS